MSASNAAKPEGASFYVGQGNRAEQRIARIAIIVVSAYVGAQMVADIASLKIGVIAGFAVDMGTFIYPITFTLRDVAHKVLGRRNVQVLVLSAAVINLLMAGYLMWVASVTSDPDLGAGDRICGDSGAGLAHCDGVDCRRSRQ